MNNPEFACEICGLYFDKYDIDVHQSICNHDSQVKFKRATPKEVLAFFDLKPDFKCSVQEISDLAEALREALKQLENRDNLSAQHWAEYTKLLRARLERDELKIQLAEMNKKYDKALIRIKDVEAHADGNITPRVEEQLKRANALAVAVEKWSAAGHGKCSLYERELARTLQDYLGKRVGDEP